MARLLIVTCAGPEEPSRASAPFHVAVNGARPSGVDCAVVIAADASALMKPAVSAGVAGLGIPPLKELLDKCLAQEIPFYVCRGCAEARGVTAAMLTPNASFISPVDLVRLTMEAERVLSF